MSAQNLLAEWQQLGALFRAAKLRSVAGAPLEFRLAYRSYRGPKRAVGFVERKWLSLRLSAVRRGMVVSSDVTPDFIRELLSANCCVTLAPMTRGTGQPTDTSIDRIVNEGVYARGNLMAVSQAVNRAKADLSYGQVAALADAFEDARGLTAVQWCRLASVMYGAYLTARGLADVQCVPMVTIPPDHTLTPNSQAVQLFLLRACDTSKPEWPGLIDRLKAAGPCRREDFDYVVRELRNAKSVTLVTVGRKQSPFIAELVEDHKVPVVNAEGDAKDQEVCPQCSQGFMALRSGRYGQFYGCSRFPACDCTRQGSPSRLTQGRVGQSR